MRKKLLYALFSFTAVTFVLAQHDHGGGGDHAGHASAPSVDSPVVDFRKAIMMQATDDQRMAFEKCKEATERVHQTTNIILGAGGNWHYDSSVFSGQNEQLQSALSEMTATHVQFHHVLTEAQAKGLKKHLNKLEQFQNDLSSRAAQINNDVASSKPDSRRIYNDVNKIKQDLDKWRAEHSKIAEEMGIATNEPSMKMPM